MPLTEEDESQQALVLDRSPLPFKLGEATGEVLGELRVPVVHHDRRLLGSVGRLLIQIRP